MEFPQKTSFFSFFNLFGILILTFVFIYFKNKEKSKVKRFASLFPGPKTILYFGNSLNFILHPYGVSAKLYEYVEKYGSRFRLWIGKRLYIVLSDAEDAEEVLRGNKFLNKGDDLHEIFSRIFGNGTFSAEDAAWRKSRKIIQYPLRTNVLRNYLDIINDEAKKVTKEFEPFSKSKQTFDILNFVGIFSINVVCRALYDLKEDLHKDEITIFKRRARAHLGDCFTSIFQPKLVRKIRQILSKKEFRNTENEISLLYQKVIMEGKMSQKKVSENEANVHQSYFANELGTDKTDKKFIDYLQDPTVSEKDRRDEIITYSVAGTETVSVTISLVLFTLGLYEEIQNRVYKELCDIFDNSDREATDDDLKKMIYLEQVIKEVARLYPLVPFLLRKVKEPTTLRELVLPAGTSVIINVLGLHKNPKYFPKPETFDPERFSNENCKKLCEGSYLAFSTGPRNCIGKAFAMYEMKIICSSILRKYKIHTKAKDGNIKAKHDTFLLVTADDLQIYISERNRE